MSQNKWEERLNKLLLSFDVFKGAFFYEKQLKQFISDLRKKDEEELIKIIKEEEKLGGEIFWGNGDEKIRDIIKDYYKE